MNGTNALHTLDVLVRFVAFVVKAIKDGKPERVDKIIPIELRTTLARRLADAEAEEKFRGDETRPVIRDAGNGE